MHGNAGWIIGKQKSEPRYAVTGAFCLGWSKSSDLLVGTRSDAAGAAFAALPDPLVNRTQSHAFGVLSP